MQLSQFVDMLDLNSYEKEIVLFLAGVDNVGVDVIYKNVKVPKGRIYSVLNELAHKGIITIIPTAPKKYQIEDVKKALNDYLEIKKAKVEKKIEEVKILEIKPKSYNLGINAPSVYSFTGRDEYLNALISLRIKANKTLKQVAPIFVGTFASNKAIYDALKKGVKVKVITKNITKENVKNIKECMKLGAEIRYLNTEELINFLVKDNHELILGMEDYKNREERLSLITRNKSLVLVIDQYFENLWGRSHKILNKML